MSEDRGPDLKLKFEEEQVKIMSVKPFDLDPYTAPPYYEYIKETISEHPGPRFILDLANCYYTDSAGLRALADTYIDLKDDEDGKHIVLSVGKNKGLLKLLKVTGLFDLIEVDFDDET